MGRVSGRVDRPDPGMDAAIRAVNALGNRINTLSSGMRLLERGNENEQECRKTIENNISQLDDSFVELNSRVLELLELVEDLKVFISVLSERVELLEAQKLEE